MDTTSTEELRRIQAGLLNIEVTLKVLRKDHLPPEVGVHGAYSKLFVYLCNDQEERVKMIAFGRTADNFVNLFSENSLVNFTGLEAQPPYNANDPNKRYGSLDYQLKASAASGAEEIEPNYRLKGGMPLSKVKDIDACKPFLRLKLTGQLTNDFVPYLNGLTGQAKLEDASGKVNVHVQILKVSPELKTRFRAGRKVVLRGTFRKFSTLVGGELTAVTRMVVESDGDVDFENIFGGSAAAKGNCVKVSTLEHRNDFEAATPKSTSGRSVDDAPSFLNGGSPKVPLATSTPRRLSEDTFTASSGYSSTLSFCEQSNSTSSSDWITGIIVDDFTETDLGVWGMLQDVSHEYFEIYLGDVPEGAETLFKEGELLSVRAQADQENHVFVNRWRDVRIEGADMFLVPDPVEEHALAADLRKLMVCEERHIRAKALNLFIADIVVTITALVSDVSKVIVKLRIDGDPGTLRDVNIKETPYFSVTGMIQCTGPFCVMTVANASAVRFEAADGAKPGSLDREIKQEKAESVDAFATANKPHAVSNRTPIKPSASAKSTTGRKPRSTTKAQSSRKGQAESTSSVVAASDGKPAPKPTTARKPRSSSKPQTSPNGQPESTSSVVAALEDTSASVGRKPRAKRTFWQYELVPANGTDPAADEITPKRSRKGRNALKHSQPSSSIDRFLDDNERDDEILLIDPPGDNRSEIVDENTCARKTTLTASPWSI